MNVLSLFDGISCARVALGDRVASYYASEIEPNAMKIAKKNFPDTIHVGDVRSITKESIPVQIDLLIGGSPCQDLSIAKQNRKGLEGERSGLFNEYVRIKHELNPRWFVLENVASMSKKDRDIITSILGVEPIMIDASLVSAQSRKRLFWTNIPNVTQPKDREIMLKDILQSDIEERFYVKNTNRGVESEIEVIGRDIGRRLDANGTRKDKDKSIQVTRRIELREDNKCGTLTSVTKDNLVVGKRIRRLTPIECERLQSLPDNYTEGILLTNRYKCLGNAFNVEVIRHIISFISYPTFQI
jgi:DNA (cytosine-5)-methyltransferase 3A